MKTEKTLSLRLIRCQDDNIISTEYLNKLSGIFYGVSAHLLYMRLFQQHYYSTSDADETSILYDPNETLIRPDWYVEKMVDKDKKYNIRIEKIKRILEDE